MRERKPFLLRIDAGLYAALARWADDETRSLNGQIEALLRLAVEAEGRLPAEYGRPRRLPAPPGRQPRAAQREPVPRPHGRGPSPRRPPKRLPKPAPPAPQPAEPRPAVQQPLSPRPADPRPAGARPAQRIPADSWDAMED